MIIDRDLYQKRMVKKNLNHRMEIYMIVIDKKDELGIINCLIKYTTNFLILQTDSDKKITLNLYEKYYCNLSNVNDVLENIFHDCPMEFDTEPNENKDYKNEYIVFIKEKNLSENTLSFSVFSVRSLHFNILIKSLKNFHLYDFYFYNTHAVIKLTDSTRCINPYTTIIDNHQIIAEQKIILSPFSGIGDFFMTSSLIYEFIKINESKSISVYFAIVENDDKVITQLDCYFPNNKKLSFNNVEAAKYCLSSFINRDVIGMLELFDNDVRNGRFNHKGIHFADFTRRVLGMNENFNIYQYSNILKDNIEKYVGEEEKKYIDQLFENKNYVGVQFFRGVYDQQNDVWSTELPRNWSEGNVTRFLEICKDKKLDILSINPSPYKNILTDQLKDVSIPAYIYAVSKVKLLIGIDSSAGHIAAFYDIPSITLWGEQDPFNFEGTMVNFRALRKNISIYSKCRDINKVNPEFVYEKMKEILNGNIILDSETIMHNDNQNIFIAD